MTTIYHLLQFSEEMPDNTIDYYTTEADALAHLKALHEPDSMSPIEMGSQGYVTCYLNYAGRKIHEGYRIEAIEVKEVYLEKKTEKEINHA